jgi:hypothetical protein
MSDRMYKTVRFPCFYEQAKNFQEFDIRHFAYATYYGCAKAIGTTPDPDLPGEDMDIDDPAIDPLIKKALQRNNAAMCNYTMSLNTNGLLGMAHKSKSPEWLNGQARKISKMLKERFAPQDLTSKTELRVALSKVLLFLSIEEDCQ